MTRIVATTVSPAGARGLLEPDAGTASYQAQANDHGRLEFTIPTTTTGGGWLTLSTPGYRSVHIRCILDPELRFEPDFTAHPIDLAKLELSRIHTDGLRFVTEDGSPWRYKGFTSFQIYRRFREGQDQDLRPVIAEMTELGANVVRVFLQWFVFGVLPLDALGDCLDFLRDEGQLYAKIDGLCDCQSFGMDQHTQQQRIGAIERAIDGRPAFFSLGNEWQKNGFDPTAFAKPAIMLCSRGSAIQDGQIPWPAWDYAEAHPARKPDSEWIVKATDPIYYQVLGYPQGHLMPLPIVLDEIQRAGGQSTDVQAYELFAQIAVASRAAGVTFYSDACRDSVPLPPIERACAEAFFRGLS